MYVKLSILICVLFYIGTVSSAYDDKRCKLVCPRTVIGNVPPSKCNCDGIILPKAGELVKGTDQDLCPGCECVYEYRNTTIIQVVVILVVWVIMLLVAYMGFLICLDPLINKRAKASYQEHTNEDDESTISGPSQQSGARGNVLNRVTHQQDKWKRQVREQRRNIYDRHTMLN